MADEGMKEYFRVLHAFLSHNAAYRLFCAGKNSHKDYRKELLGAGLSSVMIDHHFEKYYQLLGDPSNTDFKQLWEENWTELQRKIYDFQDISKTFLREEVKNFLARKTTSPSEADLVEFINSRILNRQFGSLIGSGKKLLLSIDLNHSTVNGLTSEFSTFIKKYELAPPPSIRYLRHKHFHLLLVIVGSYAPAKDAFMKIYGVDVEPPTKEVTFLENPERSEHTVHLVQFNIMNGKFPGSSSLTKGKNFQFQKILESGMLMQK